jgi:hypothetical protein
VIGIAYCLIIIRVGLTDTSKTNTVFSVAQVYSRQAASASSSTIPMEPIAVNLTQRTHIKADARSDTLDPNGKTAPSDVLDAHGKATVLQNV